MALKKKTTPRKKPKKSDGPKSVPKKAVKQPKQKMNHPKFGTSKLEQDFATEFLDKLGVDYVWQYEAAEIGRLYDFAVKSPGGGIILIEIDGSYYHSDPRLVKEEDMSPMQKKNKRVDEIKNQWALMHSIPLIRIWEKDIRENPNMVMDYLKQRLYIENTKQELKIGKNKRHINKLNNLKTKKENDKH